MHNIWCYILQCGTDYNQIIKTSDKQSRCTLFNREKEEFAQKVHEFKHSRIKANNSAKTEDLPTALSRITDEEEKEKEKRKCLICRGK